MVPIVGKVSAGQPILAVENIEDTFPLPTNFVDDGEYFMLQITGDSMIEIEQDVAETTMRQLATQEGIFCGVSSGGAVAAALRLSEQVENAVIVSIICDRGDRYLSTGVFPSD